MTEQDLIYIAGVLDYNNAIRMRTARGMTVPIIQVTHADRKHIMLLAKHFGRRINYRSSGQFVFQRSHGQAVEVVRTIRPYIRLNCEAADLVLAWKPQVRVRPPTPKVPCPDCGNEMSRGAKSCVVCYKKSSRFVQYKPANQWNQLSVADRKAPAIKDAVKVERTDKCRP